MIGDEAQDRLAEAGPPQRGGLAGAGREAGDPAHETAGEPGGEDRDMVSALSDSPATLARTVRAGLRALSQRRIGRGGARGARGQARSGGFHRA